MTKLLHIDSSILGDHSTGRALTADVVAHFRAKEANLEVTHRDLVAQPLPHLDMELFSQFGKDIPADAPRRDEHVQSAEVLAEFEAADIVVIAAPLYNFGVPSQLKSWIDRLMIAGRTFRYVPTGIEGLIGQKKIVIVATRGGIYEENTPAAAFEHETSYLKAVFASLGQEVTAIIAEGLARNGGANRDAILAAAKDKIAAL
ncbi:ACP phosphodiesterase [Neokomagataea thailandica NBRC 106555]|uniref:FMN dependent NADH:quinone oxidoreductase n=2 Tax=Neokomagataea TaxID=1223423 RepID=A0A4Y6V3K4_9PROT|nr:MULTISPECIES: NAD(P)H-dependent oxidoreductase [Neokomagataea]QDH24639.1 FMN-dependent NADH-azoreductase [Neokomagataea tanensis]GBR53980.1 ACP phosphodiesterase [Neokomagataea thailandica NBRC 106555]